MPQSGLFETDCVSLGLQTEIKWHNLDKGAAYQGAGTLFQQTAARRLDPAQFNEVPILICGSALVAIDSKSNLGQNWWGLLIGNEAGGT